MSKLFSCLSNQEVQGKRVIVVGLKSAGKTTIIKKFQPKLGKNGYIISSTVFLGDSFKFKNITFIELDTENLRSVSQFYLKCLEVQGLMFVVDSNDRKNHPEARIELWKLLQEESLKDVPVLVYANNQQLKNAMNKGEMMEILGLDTLVDRNWKLQPVCVTSGDGVLKGLQWMKKQLKKDHGIKEGKE